MNARSILLFVSALVVALSLTVAAQDKKDSSAVSITGCFNKGKAADRVRDQG